LSFSQKDVPFSDNAIECRINAENPYQNFKPSSWRIEMLHVPGGSWVRFDSAIYHGYEIPPFYVSMIGKLVVWAQTRDEAVRKMKAALCELTVEGIEHNADFLMDVLELDEFARGTYTTGTLAGMLGEYAKEANQ
jgi:acetyl-CoA carboxylase biotin carboxylase subunit